MQDRGGASGSRVSADIDQPRLDFGDPVGVLRGFGLGEKSGALGIGGEHHVEQRFRPARRFLRDGADAQTAPPR
jgi:hypothetical protein